MNNLINCFLLHWELRIYTTHTSSGLLDVSNGGASSQQGQMIILQNTKRASMKTRTRRQSSDIQFES